MEESKPHDMITVVENIYHIPFNEQPKQIENRYSKHLQTSEQLYERRCLATTDWKPLDKGWVDNASMIVIVNTEGNFTQVNPTDEERQALAARKLLVSADCNDNGWIICPGESLRATPTDLNNIFIKSLCDSDVSFMVYIIPA